MTEYTPEQIAELKRHSQMLGRIAGLVSDFCDDEETTTEEAVLRLVSMYHSAKQDEAWSMLVRLQKERKQTNDN